MQDMATLEIVQQLYLVMSNFDLRLEKVYWHKGLDIGVSEGQRNMHFLKVYPPISIQPSQLPHQPTNLNE
jgi:hypothetical protein